MEERRGWEEKEKRMTAFCGIKGAFFFFTGIIEDRGVGFVLTSLDFSFTLVLCLLHIFCNSGVGLKSYQR